MCSLRDRIIQAALNYISERDPEIGSGSGRTQSIDQHLLDIRRFVSFQKRDHICSLQFLMIRGSNGRLS